LSCEPPELAAILGDFDEVPNNISFIRLSPTSRLMCLKAKNGIFSENWHTKTAGLNALNHVDMKILSGSALHRR
jgi:hypothetical protein